MKRKQTTLAVFIVFGLSVIIAVLGLRACNHPSRGRESSSIKVIGNVAAVQGLPYLRLNADMSNVLELRASYGYGDFVYICGTTKPFLDNTAIESIFSDAGLRLTWPDSVTLASRHSEIIRVLEACNVTKEDIVKITAIFYCTDVQLCYREGKFQKYTYIFYSPSSGKFLIIDEPN